jgi:uncharacterized protein with von Willebrand factor type A (vWA) domain
MSGNVYDVTDYQSSCWRLHTVEQPAAAQAEHRMDDRYQGAATFAAEVFHRLYAEEPRQLDPPADGSDVWQQLHRAIDQVPELADLRAQCQGRERWAGMGAQAVIETLLDKVQAPAEQVRDLAQDAETRAALERMIAATEQDQDGSQDAQDALQAARDALAAHDQQHAQGLAQAAEQAALMDPSDVRNAMRAAAKVTRQQIQDEEQLVAAFGPLAGNEQHSRGADRQDLGRRLSDAVKASPKLRRIAQLAGRLRRIARLEQANKLPQGTQELAGITLGDDLTRVLPSEMLWAHPKLRAVFAARYTEKALACHELKRKPQPEEGPIVMLMDSSGSMEGDPIAWAAAVALAFAECAARAKRPFILIHFGSDVLRVDRFDRPSDMDPVKIAEAVTFFQSAGGTGFMGPLDRALAEVKGSTTFKHADIIMITDGNAAISSSWEAHWKAEREALAFRCWSILVGPDTDTDTAERFSTEVVHLNEVLREEHRMHKIFGEV